jgi:hypothetical protein
MERESKELVDLDNTINGVHTTAYTVACKALGTRPVPVSDFAAPTIFGGRDGYMADGPALGGKPGLFNIYVTFNTDPEDVMRLAAILRLV